MHLGKNPSSLPHLTSYVISGKSLDLSEFWDLICKMKTIIASISSECRKVEGGKKGEYNERMLIYLLQRRIRDSEGIRTDCHFSQHDGLNIPKPSCHHPSKYVKCMPELKSPHGKFSEVKQAQVRQDKISTRRFKDICHLMIQSYFKVNCLKSQIKKKCVCVCVWILFTILEVITTITKNLSSNEAVVAPG